MLKRVMAQRCWPDKATVKNSENMMEDRITELEIRLTHLEETLEIYDAAIIKQNTIADESDETPPPHY